MRGATRFKQGAEEATPRVVSVDRRRVVYRLGGYDTDKVVVCAARDDAEARVIVDSIEAGAALTVSSITVLDQVVVLVPGYPPQN